MAIFLVCSSNNDNTIVAMVMALVVIIGPTAEKERVRKSKSENSQKTNLN